MGFRLDGTNDIYFTVRVVVTQGWRHIEEIGGSVCEITGLASVMNLRAVGLGEIERAPITQDGKNALIILRAPTRGYRACM